MKLNAISWMRGLAVVSACWISSGVHAQIIPAAVPDIVLDGGGVGSTAMDVAYNPGLDLYYSVYGGSPNVPILTHDGTTGAVLLNTAPSSHDWRGAWWNSNLNQLEGNPCSSCQRVAIFSPDLNASGYALATGTVLNPTNQPDFQAQGDYNEAANEFVYYEAGEIHRVDRATNTSLPTITITGLPVSTGSLNLNLIGYTGMAGAEYVVWDYVNGRALFIDASGAYQGESVIPGPPATSSSWNVGYANGRIFIWNGSGWNSYVVNGVAPAPAPPGGAKPIPVMPLSAMLLTVFGLLAIAGRRLRRGRFPV